jgi:hypothetical protein
MAFQRISNHIVVSGSDELTITYLKQLRLVQAKVPLLGKDNFQNYEAAHTILQFQPSLKGKIVIHCNSIRFMRFMADSEVAKQCINFNAYQLAASALVQQHLLLHYVQTVPKDVVVIAGLGLFGQTILEEL